MKRRDFLKVVGGVAAVTAVGAVAAKPRAAKARVCERQNGLLDRMWPVGSIYISIDSNNPGDRFGGVWVRFAQGSTLVGVQVEALPGFPLDPDFNFSSTFLRRGEKMCTLTEEQMPSHSHNYLRVENSFSNQIIMMNIGNTFTLGRPNASTGSRGDNQPHNNLPPYITVFMWRRSA